MKLGTQQIKGIGKVGLRIGKAIVIQGTQAVIMNATAKAFTTAYSEGIDAVKNLKFGDYLGENKKKKGPKKHRKGVVEVTDGDSDPIEVEIEYPTKSDKK